MATAAAYQDEEFCLDEARETLYTLMRSCERFAANLGKTVEVLNGKKADDEWLLEVLEEAEKGVNFHQQQLACFQAFHARAEEYINEVRREAELLAMAELACEQGEQGEDEGEAPNNPEVTPVPKGMGKPKRSSKFVHPELVKFKLEKQARILGKYGGVPALGAGMTLPRLMQESILKATGSTAAREIHYSKAENKDAAQLAQVMRFKARSVGGEDGAAGSQGGTPAPSPWQAEMSTRKGKSAYDGTDAKDQATPSTVSHAAYATELGSALKQRQASVQVAIEAERAAARAGPAPTGPIISQAANDELASKLKHRQEVTKQEAEAAARAAAEAAEAAAPPATPSWSNPSAPFGVELATALRRRAESATPAASAGGAPLPPPAASSTAKHTRSSSGSEATTNTGGTSSFEASLNAAAAGGGSAATPGAAPAGSHRRGASMGMAGTPAPMPASSSAATTPWGAQPRRTPGGGGHGTVALPLPPVMDAELQQKLRARSQATTSAEAAASGSGSASGSAGRLSSPPPGQQAQHGQQAQQQDQDMPDTAAVAPDAAE